MVTAMARNKISTTVYITRQQDALLKELHGCTHVPVAEYIRQGIDLILQKYAEKLPGLAHLHGKSDNKSDSKAHANARLPTG